MSEFQKTLTAILLPGIFVLSILEGVVLSRYRSYDWKAMGVSIVDLIGRQGILLLFPLSLAAPIFSWAWEYRLGTISMSSWSAFFLLFLGQEFCYYWLHRSVHRINWFWANHSVHHTPNELTLGAAYRTGMLGNLIGATVFFAPLVWVGFPYEAVIQVYTINLLYQVWLHTTWIPKLGWLEYVINTPSSHRVHHASNPEYLDKNYGGVLIIFDRLFGTYVEEANHIQCKYGLVKPIQGYNFFEIEFSRWKRLFQDLLSARSISTALGILARPPSWEPPSSRLPPTVLAEAQDPSRTR